MSEIVVHLLDEFFDGHGVFAEVFHINLALYFVNEVDGRGWHSNFADSAHGFDFLKDSGFCEFFVKCWMSVFFFKTFLDDAWLSPEITEINSTFSSLTHNGLLLFLV